MKRLLPIFLFFFIGLATGANAEVTFVQKVTQGDIFQTLEGEEVRLIGVDIPELKPDVNISEHARVSQNKQNALDYVRSLISGSNVEIRVDAKERDDQGRILAYVWFLYPEDNYMEALEFPDDHEVHRIVDPRDYGNIVFLNAALIKAGYAKPEKDEFNNSFASLFNSIYYERNIQAVQGQPEPDIDIQASAK